MPQVDRLDQEVQGKGECVVFSERPTEGPWLCHGDEEEAWYRVKGEHHVWGSSHRRPTEGPWLCLVDEKEVSCRIKGLFNRVALVI